MMSNNPQPLILVTNDDGIDSPGLAAAVAAVQTLGQVLVVAPRDQQTGASRNFLRRPGAHHRRVLHIDGREVPAIAIEASPAQVVRAALLLIVPRTPDLLIAGINYGENVGAGVTISGTIGACIEGATFGIPALAVSLETEIQNHLTHNHDVDFTAAAAITRRIAQVMLERPLPPGVDILKVDIPKDATPETPWRITRVSRQRYFESIVVEDPERGKRRFAGYRREVNLHTLEPDSDVHALVVDHVVSITPLTFDLTAHVSRDRMVEYLQFEAGIKD